MGVAQAEIKKFIKEQTMLNDESIASFNIFLKLIYYFLLQNNNDHTFIIQTISDKHFAPLLDSLRYYRLLF